MSNEAKALVERLRGDWPEILVEKHWMMDSDAIDKQRAEAADLIETQAREIERLRGALQEMPEPHEYLGPVDLRLIRSYIDARRTWRHKHRAALAGDSHDQ